MKHLKLFENYKNLTFDYLYSLAPDELKEYLNNLKDIHQRPDKHPEDDVFTHTRVVVNRLSKFNDIDLSLAGIFHDIGKQDMFIWNDEKGFHQHPGHEDESVKYVEKFRDWIEEMGGDYDIVYGIVENHMRIKIIDEMRKSKQQRMMDLPYFKKLVEFESCDKGGFE